MIKEFKRLSAAVVISALRLVKNHCKSDFFCHNASNKMMILDNLLHQNISCGDISFLLLYILTKTN